MHPLLLQLVLLGNLVAVGALLVIQPRIARRGLLFGVYVGEERWAGADAARITRTWYLGMAAIAALSLAAGEAVIFLQHDPSVFVEKRFGLGYTINFGNPIALAMLVVFLAIVLAIVLTSAFLPQSQTPPR